MFKLIGILIIVIGFIKKYDTLAVVITAGIATGLVGGMDLMQIFDVIGTSFVKTRYMSLFLLTLPVIGILERYGLREQAANLISSMKRVTAGSVLSIYTLIRLIAGALSVRLGGHVQFIRPLINPMAFGAAKNNNPVVGEEEEEIIKGHAAASENYGNFFGQNVFVASAGVLLIVGTLEELGTTVSPLDVAKASVPIAIIAFIYSGISYWKLDQKLSAVKAKSKTVSEKGA